jgi:hypothetical protein
VECRPLPAGCERGDLCTLACVHEVCPGSYQCSVGDPCDFGEDSLLCAQRLTCDPFEARSCTVAGTHCAPVAVVEDAVWDWFSCVPAPRSGPAPGEPCALVSDGSWTWGDCEAGSACIAVDPDTMQGTCAALCTGSFHEPGCADADAACILWNGEIGLYVCEPTCDPLAGVDACAAGQVCISAWEPEKAWVCVVDASGVDGGAGTACEATNGCDPGLACIDEMFYPDCPPGEEGCCSPYCDLGAPTCAGGLSCEPWYGEEEAPAGHEDIGVCVLKP